MRRFLTSATPNASNLISLRHFYGAARFKDDLLEKFNQEVVRSQSLGFEEQQVKEATSKVKLHLENAALAGCEESLRTINLMSQFSREYAVLDFSGFDEAAKQGPYAMQFCSNVLMRLVGYTFGEISKIKAVEEKKVGLPPHIDGGVGSSVEALSLMGIKSSGSVKTYAISAKEVFEKLSPETAKILTARIFKHKRNLQDFAMFEVDASGNVSTNFSSYVNADLDDFDLPLKKDEEKRLFTYNAEKLGCSNDEVEKAMAEAVAVLSNLWEKNAVKEMAVKTGSIILIHNKLAYHGRGSYEERHSDNEEELKTVAYKERRVTRCFYRKDAKICEFHLPNSATKNALASKLSPQENVRIDGLQ